MKFWQYITAFFAAQIVSALEQQKQTAARQQNNQYHRGCYRSQGKTFHVIGSFLSYIHRMPSDKRTTQSGYPRYCDAGP